MKLFGAGPAEPRQFVSNFGTLHSKTSRANFVVISGTSYTAWPRIDQLFVIVNKAELLLDAQRCCILFQERLRSDVRHSPERHRLRMRARLRS